MKKIIVMATTVATLMAGDITQNVNLGLAQNSTSINSFSDTSSGVTLGYGADMTVMDKLSVGGEFQADLLADLNVYTLAAVAKYEVIDKLNLGFGLNYNMVNIDGFSETLSGVGFQVQTEYEVMDNILVNAKYKMYTASTSGLDADMTGLSIGVGYSF